MNFFLKYMVKSAPSQKVSSFESWGYVITTLISIKQFQSNDKGWMQQFRAEGNVSVFHQNAFFLYIFFAELSYDTDVWSLGRGWRYYPLTRDFVVL